MRPSEALAKHRDEVLAILAKYPVKNPRVFGSVARGEDREDSDLDLLVERVGDLTYFDIFDMEEALRDLLGTEVEVCTVLRPHAAASAQGDLRPL